MKNLDYKKITFRKAQKFDEKLLKIWFNKPHVQEFWDNSPEMWQNVISYLNGNKILYDYWIGSFENMPYCLIITSDATDNERSNAPGLDNHLLPYIDPQEKTLTIDFMIGEEAFLEKGLSYLTLNKFTDIQEGINSFIIDPEASNAKAIHVYEKAGFKKVGSYTPKKGFFSGLKHNIMKKYK
jgi:RimJ/RimL family protein N-acetyltransferase